MAREMKTWKGHYFDVLKPDPDKIDIEDIAHSLSTMCRFNGHIDQFYSVAEHCVLMSYMTPPEYAMEALLHDAGEAYMGDIIFPVKEMLNSQTAGLVTRIEDKLVGTIMETLMHPEQFNRVKITDSGIYLKSVVIQQWDTRMVKHEWAKFGKGDEHELNTKIVEMEYRAYLPYRDSLARLHPNSWRKYLYLNRYQKLLEEGNGYIKAA